MGKHFYANGRCSFFIAAKQNMWDNTFSGVDNKFT